ncbi:hypothetical protein [Halobacillus sp. Nhm2S1]|uniref:hypothetical protein n=1 Tax=Halobacillus sp. Nhm2S1 TaxID=2866716 RepID=UPI001C7388E0|nr:hypothetical protein [Halobacillus sp. Nhm2S1]MBX0358480.1 hypothetical protein [Halobacillus sp. Nhm2S1]
MFKNKKFRMYILNNCVLYWVVSKLIPNLESKIIMMNLLEHKREINSQPDTEFYNPDLTVEQIEKLQIKELERNKGIEDKAKITIAGITIAIAFLSSGFTIFNFLDSSGFFNNKLLSIGLLTLYILSFSYFVLSGINALSALSLKEVHDIYLDDEIELSVKPESARISKMVKNLRLNYSTIPQREIYLNASYQCIKNAILLLMLGVLIIGGGYIYGELFKDKVNTQEPKLIAVHLVKKEDMN